LIGVLDRNYSVLLYLKDCYKGGELRLINQHFTFKPKLGMLIAFPSDHRYLHAALPTRSGNRHAIMSWGAVIGSTRVRVQLPDAAVFVRQKRIAATPTLVG
jgi:predicted 2-oxoglutarate/Fe(II)-dependent dioxygenase YbiX